MYQSSLRSTRSPSGDIQPQIKVIWHEKCRVFISVDNLHLTSKFNGMDAQPQILRQYQSILQNLLGHQLLGFTIRSPTIYIHTPNPIVCQEFHFKSDMA